MAELGKGAREVCYGDPLWLVPGLDVDAQPLAQFAFDESIGARDFPLLSLLQGNVGVSRLPTPGRISTQDFKHDDVSKAEQQAMGHLLTENLFQRRCDARGMGDRMMREICSVLGVFHGAGVE